jgi:predicted P-loop ATPase
MEPGIKYDYTPVLVGPQGIGKSTFLATLGKDWYSDSLQSFVGKEAAEMIQGIWINELSEMTGYNRSEMATIKQFLTKRDDIYRQAYGHRTERYARKCVFFGSCNEFSFLKDATGGRRFWPVDCGINAPRKDIWKDLPNEVDQIWAEAVLRYKLAEPLFFDKELEDFAKGKQEEHRDASTKEGLIKDFVDKPIPDNYEKMNLGARRVFWGGTISTDGMNLVQRNKVCALEVWCECLGGDPKFMRRQDVQEINQILSNLPSWQRNKAVRRYGYCGIQRGFERVF